MKAEITHQEVISSSIRGSDHAKQQPFLSKKDSARLIWDGKPWQILNPKTIKFQTAEVVIPHPCGRGLLAHRTMKSNRGDD